MSSSSAPSYRARVRGSALWAAYGDALGFITELTTAKGLQGRIGNGDLTTTVAWKRRVGGKFGPTLELPAGCLSDDTQLRLATSRAIRGDGEFDAEAFAKIELTVWPAYALGAGRGSKAAAAALAKRDVSWATNFYDANGVSYVAGGGNGAAMRVQPHVWANPGRRERWLSDVLINSLSTHGHMRGVLGAVFHAGCVELALMEARIPGPKDWSAIVRQLDDVLEVIERNDTTRDIWRGLWQETTETKLPAAIKEVARECREDLKALQALPAEPESYGRAVKELGLTRSDQRGSGTKTALLAAFGAWLGQNEPEKVVGVCASELGTDTDTIATMAGAIVGAVTASAAPGTVMDRTYILREADRMAAIAEGKHGLDFPYSDVLSWSPPKVQLDVVGVDNNGPAIAGLGPVEPLAEGAATKGRDKAVWQWMRTWFGQSVLIKRREEPPNMPASRSVEIDETYVSGSFAASTSVPRPGMRQETLELLPDAPRPREVAPLPSLHELTTMVIDSGFDAELTGQILLHLVEREESIESALAFTAIVAKAQLARRDRQRRNGEELH